MDDIAQFEDKFLENETFRRFLRGVGVMHLARKFSAKELKVSDIRTRRQFIDVLKGIGADESSAIEFHLERVPPIFSAIRKCLEVDSPDSAIVLLFTCIEGEINMALRILMRLKGFSSKEVDSAIQGVDFRTKIDVLLPLLHVEVPDRIKQFSNESKIVRNKIVHFKAMPSVAHGTKDERGDFYVTRDAALKFFLRNPVDRLEEDIMNFVDDAVARVPEVQAAIKIVNKFMT